MPNTIAQLYFESAEVLLVAISSDETLAGISKKGCEILGCKKHKIVGKNWFDNFVPEANREEARNMFHEMLKGIGQNLIYWHNHDQPARLRFFPGSMPWRSPTRFHTFPLSPPRRLRYWQSGSFGSGQVRWRPHSRCSRSPSPGKCREGSPG